MKRLLPIFDTDSYKQSHYLQYPPGLRKVFSYLEARTGSGFDKIVFFGLQYIIKNTLMTPITMDDVEFAKKFYEQHVGVFNYDGWKYIVEAHNGYLPLQINAVPEGTVISRGNVLVTIENTDVLCAWLPQYIEDIIVRVWSTINVATLSYHMKSVILNAFEKSSDEGKDAALFKLVDFGSRGAYSQEAAGVGGMGHLVNFLATDNIPSILYAQDTYNTSEMLGYSIPACYDDETEILTENGFIKFSDLPLDIKVAQYSDNGTISFIYPSKYHKYKVNEELVHFSNNVCDVKVTKNHKMVMKSPSGIIFFEAIDNKYRQENSMIISGIISNKQSDITPLEQLKIAFQADGSFASNKERYNGYRNDTLPIRFSLKKERKKERLEYILSLLDFKYTKNEYDNGYAIYWISVPKNIEFVKNFSWVNLSQLNKTWADAFIYELSLWDGTTKGNNIIYSSVLLENHNIVQAIACLSGHRSRIKRYADKRGNRQVIYTTSVLLNNTEINGHTIASELVKYDGYVYCVSVETGMIIVRRNGLVAIQGNSEHSTTVSWTESREQDVFENMINQFGGKYPLIAMVMDSYDLENAVRNIIGKNLKDKILNCGSTIIVRPDSGEPKDSVLSCLQWLDEAFGSTVNTKGYKVLHKAVRVIQGDGVNYNSLVEIINHVLDNGYSIDNVAFGSGGGLLQSHNRDTYRIAQKCSYVEFDNVSYGVRKMPKTDPTKASKAGKLKLIKVDGDYKTVEDSKINNVNDNELKVVYFYNKKYGMNQPSINELTFEQVRKNTGLW